MNRLFLLDSFALIYRAYFAFGNKPLLNSKGFNVSAIHGFINTLYDILQQQQPTHLIAVFDSPETTNRSIEFDFYKAHREEMPEGIREAIPYIKKIIEGFNIPILEASGYEADDIIGTICKKTELDGFENYIVSMDKDFGQLVTNKTFIYKPAYLKNPTQIVGIQQVLEKWDIDRVEQVIDMLALMGDAADNIPGIKGIGEKTAAKLIKEFGSLEELLRNTHQLKGKLQEQVQTGKDMAIISKKLATIICDVPIEYNPHTYIVEAPNKQTLSTIFAELEFRTLGKRILGDSYSPNTVVPNIQNNDIFSNEAMLQNIEIGKQKQTDLFGNAITDSSITIKQVTGDILKGKNIHNTPHEYHIINTPEKYTQLLNKLLQQKLVSFDTETTNIDANNAQLVGMSFCFKSGKAYYLPIPEQQTDAQEILNTFKPFFDNPNIAKIGQNIKYDALVLKWYQININGIIYDTMLAHYLLEPDKRHNMNVLSEDYLGYSPIEIEELIGKKGKNQGTMRDVALDKISVYAAEDADITWQLHEVLHQALKQQNLWELYTNIETPLAQVLINMEFEGINVDIPFLLKYSSELGTEINTVKQQIYQLANTTFNLDSPKQLGTILFDHLKIPYEGKKTKTGQYSTDEEMLSTLIHKHPIANYLLNYRELSKLKSTYVDALPQLINKKTNRLHTTYNQAVAATGRLSSNNPNLQNIPIRTDRGKEIRKAFIARNNNYLLLSADYSQIELRLMAALSQDDAMIDAFHKGLDIHTATAARVYHQPLENVDSSMRRNAKMVNFGIIYGISAFGLAQRLGSTRSEAKRIIDEYFIQYPKIKTYMDTAIETARKKGYTETILGRRRYLPDIQSANATVRGFAERNAINAPIQGSAADIIKKAMINIHHQLIAQKLQSKMLLQVHDELVFDVHKSEKEQVIEIVKNGMQNAHQLVVPLVVEIGMGENWLAAH